MLGAQNNSLLESLPFTFSPVTSSPPHILPSFHSSLLPRCTAFSYLEGDPDLAFLAVYDGHGGTGVANYLKVTSPHYNRPFRVHTAEHCAKERDYQSTIFLNWIFDLNMSFSWFRPMVSVGVPHENKADHRPTINFPQCGRHTAGMQQADCTPFVYAS